MKPQTLEAINRVGACATWAIVVSSEQCVIEIVGVPVLLTFGGDGRHTFVDAKPPFDFEECILKAAEEFERACYPDRKGG